jgi:hypothetical protein
MQRNRFPKRYTANDSRIFTARFAVFLPFSRPTPRRHDRRANSDRDRGRDRKRHPHLFRFWASAYWLLPLWLLVEINVGTGPRDGIGTVVATVKPIGSIILWPVETTRYPMTHKRGNPNWGRPTVPVLAVPTAFEEQARKLGLTEQTCATSDELRQWCERNKDRCYIPEWLLKRLRISVNPNVSG